MEPKPVPYVNSKNVEEIGIPPGERQKNIRWIRPTLKNRSFPITHIAKQKSPGQPVKLFLPYSN